MRSAPLPRCQRLLRCSASQLMVRMSRWFVGSSSMSTSQSPISRRARSTRRRWPPESSPTAPSQGTSAMSPLMTWRTRGLEAHSYSGASPTTARRTVEAASRSSAWPSRPTRTSRRCVTRPPSGSSTPASTESSVDLPSPFLPTMPMRSPSATPRVTLSKICRVGNSSETESHPKRIAIEQLLTCSNAGNRSTGAVQSIAPPAHVAKGAIAQGAVRGRWGSPGGYAACSGLGEHAGEIVV